MSDLRTPDLGFMAQMLVQATLPHKKPNSSQFTRINGNFRLTLMAPSNIGLPYGRYPRLALAWLSSEVVRTRSQRLHFGESLTAFMRATGIEASATGGPYGTLTRFALQARRLFASTVHCSYLRPDGRASLGAGFTVARSNAIWWAPKVDHHAADFFRSVIANPVPIDLAVLRALRSPFALDIYVWLTLTACPTCANRPRSPGANWRFSSVRNTAISGTSEPSPTHIPRRALSDPGAAIFQQ